MSKEAYYFSHDANARRDPEIVQLLSVYGYEGYGWYWAIIEMMREQEGYKLDTTSKFFYQGLATELSTDAERALIFVDDCVNEFQLMVRDDVSLWSNSLLKRMAKYQRVVDQRRDAGKKSAEKRKENRDNSTLVEQPLNTRATDAQQLKETKLKETKEKKEYITPHLGEHKNVKVTDREFTSLIEYVKGKDSALDYIERLSIYLKSSGKTYSNHYATMQGWYRKDDKEGKNNTGFVDCTGRKLDILK